MLAGTNLELAKLYNLRVVLETIRRFGPITRAELARRTQLTPPTVSSLVQELLHDGVVEVTGKRQGQRGQPALEWQLNPEGAFSIGLHLDRDHIVGVLTDLEGNVHARSGEAVRFTDPQRGIQALLALVQRLSAGRTMGPEQLWGVGLATPGPIDSATGTITAPPNFPGWDGIAPAALLQRALELPVYLESDAIAAAMGERWYGAGQQSDHYFYLYLGVGIGGAMVIDGHPYRGHGSDMGGIGHVPVVPGGRPCPCGSCGCLEQYASLATLADHLALGEGTLSPDALSALFAAHDPDLLAWLDDAAQHLSTALISVENLLNPERLLIGGHLPDPLLASLVTRTAAKLRALRVRGLGFHPQLRQGGLASDAAAIGAASLPFHALITPKHDVLLKRSPARAPEEVRRQKGGRPVPTGSG